MRSSPVSTDQAHDLIAAALDGLDHAARRNTAAADLVRMLDQWRVLARRVDAVMHTLAAEVEVTSAAVAATGTPLTSLLSVRGDLSAGEAAGLVFGGKELAAHPVAQRAALAGELDVKHARGVAKAMTLLPDRLDRAERDAAEALLVQAAAKTPAGKIPQLVDRVVAQVAPAALPSRDDEMARLDAQRRRALQRRHLTIGSDRDGSTVFSGSLPNQEAQPFVRLIEAYVAADRRAHREARRPDERTRGQRYADALTSLAAAHHNALATSESSAGNPPARMIQSGAAAAETIPATDESSQPMSDIEAARARLEAALQARYPGGVIPQLISGEQPRIYLTMQLEALQARAEQAGLLPDGQSLAAGELRRLCCDADLIPIVLGTDSEILDVGRSQRLVTPAIRTALIYRDGGCIFPGCGVPDVGTEAHHIKPWWAGGETALTNLVLLCPYHHALVEPARFWAGGTWQANPSADRWEVRLNARGDPELIPPAGVDPTRTPIPHRRSHAA